MWLICGRNIFDMKLVIYMLGLPPVDWCGFGPSCKPFVPAWGRWQKSNFTPLHLHHTNYNPFGTKPHPESHPLHIYPQSSGLRSTCRWQSPRLTTGTSSDQHPLKKCISISFFFSKPLLNWSHGTDALNFIGDCTSRDPSSFFISTKTDIATKTAKDRCKCNGSPLSQHSPRKKRKHGARKLTLPQAAIPPTGRALLKAAFRSNPIRSTL